ncbi:hypothetical protein PVAP13_1KG098777 [Panicum virgatum]|uniref:Uncharacterized protein n=1 Tax=Panicum virgatum TaxID=38727 RepID=A0A8T0X4H1_PANVG|nr:hypothetical protein PVAP13_1KG098777 [Panicum virgatum]KAG2656622.1 hypothetical protein PVAP13_1KG098777 [Panicum virgatum]KAG2656623.1 hypothetical protein PVAP13_1KG098777 [Panicum virgatum]
MIYKHISTIFQVYDDTGFDGAGDTRATRHKGGCAPKPLLRCFLAGTLNPRQLLPEKHLVILHLLKRISSFPSNLLFFRIWMECIFHGSILLLEPRNQFVDDG